MSVFEYILSPFIFIIKNIFLFSYSLTGDYGLSIIILSFIISLLLLPVFILIEKAKKRDDIIKNKMQPLIDEIKRVYKGQERYYYIKTINRQHNYSSLKALIPILSLLLQIPFFIAAYQFLENFEPLKNVSFLFIKDLSSPDGLFGFINILPILMTIVNLLTAYFYTRNGNTSERKQMVIVAGAFLVLLFSLPSGLVLYWTMNNVFSFLRLFITNPEVFKRNKSSINFTLLKANFKDLLPKLRFVLLFVFLGLVFSQVLWAITHNFDNIIYRIIVSTVVALIVTVFYGLVKVYYKNIVDKIFSISVKPWVVFMLLFMSVYFYFASKYYFTGANEDLSIIALLLLIPLQYISFVYFWKNKSKIKLFNFIVLVILLLGIFQLINMFSIINGEIFKIDSSSLFLSTGENSYLGLILAGIMFSIITLFFFVKFELKERLVIEGNWKIFSLSLLYILGLILFWNPLIVYASFAENFSFPASNIFVYNFIIFIIFIISLGVIYFVVPKKIKKLLEYFTLFISVIVFLYSSIIPFDVGTLQVNFFSEESNLAAPIIYFIGEAIFLFAIAFGIFKLMKRKFIRYIIIGLILINITITAKALYLSISTGNFLNITEGNNKNGKYNNRIPFSKTKKNVLYYIIDGAQGWYMKDIIEKEPELANVFEGFVWYPNTVATSNYTYASVPSMIAGQDFTIENMNKKSDLTISQKITEATEHFYDKIYDQGYFLTGNSLSYSLSKHSRINNYLPKWTNNWNSFLENKNLKEIWYTRFWENALFASSPLFLKSKIYNKNKWIVDVKIENSSELNKYNLVRILPEVSVADSDTKNFIYLHSMFNHAPWDLLDEEGVFQRDVHPFVNQQWFTQLFAIWIKWMKENDVYHNTKIILVADHGPSWWHYHHGIEKNLPIEWDKKYKVSTMEFLRLNPLLMVKDFNKKGPLKEDWRLMCNNDAYHFAFNEGDIFKDSTSRKITTFYTKWHKDLKLRKKYMNNKVFEVTDNVFKLKNWKIIDALIDKRDDEFVNNNEDASSSTKKTEKLNPKDERQRIIELIKSSDDWFNFVKGQAKDRKIPVDSMLILTANWEMNKNK